jgi:EAL domain-containing protein (putative c-di-GMP-specific phosphodiesterase class I)
MDPAKNLRNVSISLSNSLDESFVRFIVDLGRTLKISVTAEGVETVAQKDLLLSMGCNIFQGYLYSKALTADQLELWIANFNLQTSSSNGLI